MTLSGLGGRAAQTVYDSNEQYDPGHSTVGASTLLDGAGMFTDTLRKGNHYQVKIYKIIAMMWD